MPIENQTNAQRADPSIPAWIEDQLDSIVPPQIEAPYFDTHLQAWVLSRHADLFAAFHAPTLIPGHRDLDALSLPTEETARLKMREESRDALCPAHLRLWREQLGAEAHRLCESFPLGARIDLIAAYARPLCLSVAAMVTGIAPSVAADLEEPAQIASAKTADPENRTLRAPAQSANVTLRRYFRTGPEPLRDSGFVGLSQTLARLVGAAWYALIQSPEQWSLLRRSPELIDQAIEELLRYAGVVRILLRTATEEIDLNGASIRKGDRIILRVFAANHDPTRFSQADRIDSIRRDPGHFALGAGSHACVAASLIRTAIATMTTPLLTRFPVVQLVGPVEWHGGSIMRSPASLPVTFACN